MALPYVTRTTDDMWPTTVYTADGKTFDAEIEDPVSHNAIRPEITTVMDLVTRKVVGISLGRSENQKSVAEALRRSCVAHGICAIFYVDRGPGYRNEAMDADVSGLMGRLGITKAHAAPYGSQAKGRIERIQHTIWDRLAKRLPTYIGADMDKEAGDKIHKLTRREIREYGRSRALPTWAEFVKLCEDMVAEYNAKPHTSLPQIRDPETGKLRHMSPNECWEAHVVRGFEPVTVDPAEADDLFRPYEIRTTRRGEVLWNTNKYFDHALAPYHETKVMVGYDYHQADRVWVREFDKETAQPGKLICVARFMANAERYFPVSYEQQAIENRAKGQLKRLERKIEAVEAERAGQQLVDLRAASIPAGMFDAPAAEMVTITAPGIRTAGIDRDSERARQIMQEAELAADLQAKLDRVSDAWDSVQQAGEDAIDGIFDALKDGDIGGAFENLADEIGSMFEELAIKNPLKNAIFGTDYATMGDVGGLQGIWDRYTGKPGQIDAKSLAATAAAQTVASMNVTAATVIIGGAGVSSLAGGIGAAGGMGGLQGSEDVQKQVWSYFSGKGLKPHQVAAIMGNVQGESSFNPLAGGDIKNGLPTSFGLFQHHGPRAAGLLDAIGGRQNLGNVQGQLDYAWRELNTTHSGALAALKAAPDVSSATNAWMRQFERPSDEAMQKSWATRLGAAEAAMAKFGTTTTLATGQLGTMGTGFDKFGQALGSAVQGGGGGGFWGTLFSGIMSGLGSLYHLLGRQSHRWRWLDNDTRTTDRPACLQRRHRGRDLADDHGPARRRRHGGQQHHDPRHDDACPDCQPGD